MKRYLLILFTAIHLQVFCQHNSIENTDLAYMDCSSIYTYFGSYKPEKISALEDLPETIRTRLTRHLRARLGQTFYSGLQLEGGIIVDTEKLHAIDKDSKNYKWTPYTYYLCFSFKDPSKGIGRATAEIVLDKEGRVKKEINLPDYVKSPDKLSMISLAKAKQIAVKNGMNTVSDVRLIYDIQTDTMLWKFEGPLSKENCKPVLLINTNNGLVVDKYNSNVIR